MVSNTASTALATAATRLVTSTQESPWTCGSSAVVSVNCTMLACARGLCLQRAWLAMLALTALPVQSASGLLKQQLRAAPALPVLRD